MNEAELTREVATVATSSGILWHHCPQARRCLGPAGFPDVILLGERGLLMAELKVGGNTTTASQDLWAWTAYRAGLTIPVLTPADLTAGRIRDMIGAIR